MSQDRPPIRPFELPPDAPNLEPVSERAAGSEFDETGEMPLDPAPERPWLRRLTRLGIAALFGLLLIQTGLYIWSLITLNPLVGWPFTILFTIVAISAVAVFGREFLDLRRMRHAHELRSTGLRLAGSDMHGESAAFIAALDQHMRAQGSPARHLVRQRPEIDEHLDDGEAIMLYERHVLSPLDKMVYRHVLEASRDIGLLTALSPLGLMDGLLVMWRTTIMLRTIARTYGLVLGPTASLRLLRLCLRNAAIAGVADMVTHAALEHVGASLTALLSARASQGAGNALLAARLGLEAIRQTRPLPFIGEQPPQLRNIREAIFANRKDLRPDPVPEKAADRT